MKFTYLIVGSIVALAGLSACGDKAKPTDDKVKVENTAENMTVKNSGSLKIAYYVQDSLNVHYEYFAKEQKAMEKKQLALQNSLASKQQTMESTYQTYTKRLQNNELSQVQDQEYQRKLQNMQNELMQLQQTEGARLEGETMEKLKTISDKINAASKKYCEKHNIDMLFAHSPAGQISYINSAFDVTEDFTKFLNEEEKKIQEELK